MKDPRLPLQAACVVALKAAITAAGYTSSGDRVLVDPEHAESYPYAVIGNTTVIDFPTKTTKGGECTFSFTAWGDSWTSAMTFADYCLRALTDDDNPILPTGYTTAQGGRLDFAGDTIRDEQPPNTYWGLPVRVRFKLVEAP